MTSVLGRALSGPRSAVFGPGQVSIHKYGPKGGDMFFPGTGDVTDVGMGVGKVRKPPCRPRN